MTAQEIARAAAEEQKIRQSSHTRVTRSVHRSCEEEMSERERSNVTTTSTTITGAAGGNRGVFGAIKEMVQGKPEGEELSVEQGFRRGYEEERARDSSGYGVGATGVGAAGTGGGMLSKAKEVLVDRPVEAVKVRVTGKKCRGPTPTRWQ